MIPLLFATTTHTHSLSHTHALTQACRFSGYLAPYFQKLASTMDATPQPTLEQFIARLKKTIFVKPSLAAQFVELVNAGGPAFAEPEHLRPLLQEVLHTHPGLKFLEGSVDFH